MLFDSYAGDRGGVDGGDSLKVLNKRVAETSNPDPSPNPDPNPNPNPNP